MQEVRGRGSKYRRGEDNTVSLCGEPNMEEERGSYMEEGGSLCVGGKREGIPIWKRHGISIWKKEGIPIWKRGG